jgi:membrane protease YdiL (CAAX protease family)
MLLRRQWRLEDFLQRTLVLVACFYAAVLIGFWVQRTTGAPGPSVGQTVVSALSFQGAVLVLVGTFLRDQEATWTEAFGLLDNVGRALLLGWVAGCLFLPVGWGLQWLSVEALIHLPRLELQPEQQQVVRSVQMAATPLHWIALGGVTILLAPVGEEILFRGILYPWIKRAGYARLALWGTAFLFGAIHTNLATFVPLTVLALILTILYERTGNLLAPIAAHALFNAVNFFHLYLLQRA